ncbi:PRC-barrel domain-containing protein [Natronospora cellulosivora (SeqCode)]
MYSYELMGKEVINLQGEKLGKVKNIDIILEASNGQVESIILRNNNKKIIIPWNGVKQIGSQVIIVDTNISY